MSEKVFRDTRTQIGILKSRGLTIKNNKVAKRIIRKVNYYNLIRLTDTRVPSYNQEQSMRNIFPEVPLMKYTLCTNLIENSELLLLNIF